MPLQIKTNAKDVASSIRNVKIKLKKGMPNSLRLIAIKGKKIARSLAPVKSGELKNGIFYKSFKDRAEIISAVNNSFPYHLWVNGTVPFNILNFKDNSFQPFFRLPQAVKYGVTAISPSGNNIAWSGRRGYFDETANILRKNYGRIFDVQVGKILKSR